MVFTAGQVTFTAGLYSRAGNLYTGPYSRSGNLYTGLYSRSGNLYSWSLQQVR